MSKAGKRLIGAARDALAVAKGSIQPAGIYIPPDIDVKSIRHSTGETQESFARNYGFTLAQIRDWEQARSRPVGGDRAYLLLIESYPNEMKNFLREASQKAADKTAA